MSKAVNIYDFDHTIYDGDASLDFILFTFSRNIRLWKYVPSMGWALFLYIFGLQTRKQIKQVAFRFLRDMESIEEALEVFWRRHDGKIKQWYLNQKKVSDVIVSASPEFLLLPATKKVGVKNLIATTMNPATGLIQGKNCRGEEKVRRLQQFFDGKLPEIQDVYSDSQSDVPIFKLGKRAFVVRGSKFIAYDEYKPSKLKSLKSPAFLRFLLVGGVNACIGVMLAWIFSLFIASPQLAFVVGFTISLVPSYYLNSVVTFRDFGFTMKKFGKFVVSYMPNFAVQFVLVHILTDTLHLYPLITYTFAVIVAVPVTFLLLRWFAFYKEGE